MKSTCQPSAHLRWLGSLSLRRGAKKRHRHRRTGPAKVASQEILLRALFTDSRQRALTYAGSSHRSSTQILSRDPLQTFCAQILPRDAIPKSCRDPEKILPRFQDILRWFFTEILSTDLVQDLRRFHVRRSCRVCTLQILKRELVQGYFANPAHRLPRYFINTSYPHILQRFFHGDLAQNSTDTFVEFYRTEILCGTSFQTASMGAFRRLLFEEHTQDLP